MPDDARLKRLFNMLTYLGKYSDIKTVDFARQYGVSTRTVQRDIAILKEAGIGVAQRETGGLYVTSNGYQNLRKWLIHD